MFISSFDEEPPLLEGVRSQSYQTNKVFSCCECTYAFTSQSYLHKHMTRYHNDIYCQMLRNGQIPSAVSQQTVSSVTSRKPAGDAGKTRPHRRRRPTMTLTHPGEVGEVNIHQLTYSGRESRICKQCDKRLTQLSKLDEPQQRLHAGQKPHRCQQCGKSFNVLAHLKRHQRIHTGEKPYYCKECDKSFNELGHLKRHQRIHTGEKPYHCRECNKSFNVLDNLKTHQHTHTGERPYNCKQCEKSFKELCSLKRHQRIHTGEKPYYCKQCDKAFNYLGNLRKHQRQTHWGKT